MAVRPSFDDSAPCVSPRCRGTLLETHPPFGPIPVLPTGAGGPRERAAGRVSTALVLDPDPLLRLLAVSAVRALGFGVAEEDGGGQVLPQPPAAVFLGLHAPDGCPRLRSGSVESAGPPARHGRVRPSRPPLVGYAAGPGLVLAAHRAHGCCDLQMRLVVSAGDARLVYPAPGRPPDVGFTLREADVFLLLLAGLTTPAVAARLGISAATARTHGRAVLRKTGAADRRALRARVLDGPAPVGPRLAARAAGRGQTQGLPGSSAKFAEE